MALATCVLFATVTMSRSITQLERELREARRLNEDMYVPTYVPLSEPNAPAPDDPDFDPYQLGNESLRNFLHTQGASDQTPHDPAHLVRLQASPGLC